MGALGQWAADKDYLKLRPQVLTILIILVILTICIVIYYTKLKKVKVNETPRGFVLIMQIYVEYIRNMVVEVLGKKLEKLTPYFIFLMSYLILSNMIGILGLENPTSSLTVTLSLGLIMFFGTFVIGFRYQKLSYLTRFCIKIKSKKTGKHYGIMVNPLNIVEVITPLISISFRLWGNIFAGGTVISLWFFLWGNLQAKIPVIGVLNVLGGLTAPPLHGYFDLLCGLIQALVFTQLTIVYWKLAMEEGNYEINNNEEPKVIAIPNVNI